MLFDYRHIPELKEKLYDNDDPKFYWAIGQRLFLEFLKKYPGKDMIIAGLEQQFLMYRNNNFKEDPVRWLNNFQVFLDSTFRNNINQEDFPLNAIGTMETWLAEKYRYWEQKKNYVTFWRAAGNYDWITIRVEHKKEIDGLLSAKYLSVSNRAERFYDLHKDDLFKGQDPKKMKDRIRSGLFK